MEYLLDRLNSIENTIRFVLSSTIIIVGFLAMQLFKVLDEVIFPYFPEMEFTYITQITLIDLLRVVSLIITILILTVIAILVFNTMDSRRDIIKNKIGRMIFNEGLSRDEWETVKNIDYYNNILHFLLGKFGK